jgi:hypothetical protein
MLIAQVRVEEGRKLGSMSHLDHERRTTTRHLLDSRTAGNSSSSGYFGSRYILENSKVDKIQVLDMT